MRSQDLHIEAIHFRAVHIHPSDARHRSGVAQVSWLRPRRRLGAVHSIQVAKAGDQPHIVRPTLVRGTGSREQIPVARGIDDCFGQDGLPPRLALEHGTVHGRPIDDGVDAPAMQQDLDPRLFNHLHHEVLHRLRVHGGRDARPAIDNRTFQAIQAAHHLFANSLADLLTPFHDMADHQQHQAAGPQSAKVPIPLDDCHLRTSPPGSNRGTNAGRPAPDDQHVCGWSTGSCAPAAARVRSRPSDWIDGAAFRSR